MRRHFSEIIKIFIEPAALPPIGENKISFKNSEKRLTIHHSGLAGASKVSSDSECTTATLGWINLPQRITKRNSIDTVKSKALRRSKASIVKSKRRPYNCAPSLISTPDLLKTATRRVGLSLRIQIGRASCRE